MFMMKKYHINREVFIWKDSPGNLERYKPKSFLIWGEISGRLVRKALSIPTLEFLKKFDKNSEPRKNIMEAWEVRDSKGNYLFYETTGSVLRCWTSYSGGNAQIDPYQLDMYKRPLEKYQLNDLPARISSDNIDHFKAQKSLALMFKKYVNFLEEY
jgi:hypothetical protein